MNIFCKFKHEYDHSPGPYKETNSYVRTTF